MLEVFDLNSYALSVATKSVLILIGIIFMFLLFEYLAYRKNMKYASSSKTLTLNDFFIKKGKRTIKLEYRLMTLQQTMNEMGWIRIGYMRGIGAIKYKRDDSEVIIWWTGETMKYRYSIMRGQGIEHSKILPFDNFSELRIGIMTQVQLMVL